MSTRACNLEKKWRKCLRCGKKMKTDRCHRTCPRCRDDNTNRFERKAVKVATSGKRWDGEADPDFLDDDPEAAMLADLLGDAS